MTYRRRYFSFSLGQFGVIAAFAGAFVVTPGKIIGFTRRAAALPSFARQTGQPCGKCHTDFPALTPFGRQFKLGGYTLGGGDYRTTLFPSADASRSDTNKKTADLMGFA